MIDKDKSHDVDNGIIVNINDNGDSIEGPFFTGGPDSPMGLDLPINTFYAQTTSTGVLNWRKFGSNDTDWLINENAFRTNNMADEVYVPANELVVLTCREYDNNLIIDGEAYFI